MKNNRRQFLKNTALTTVSLGITPLLANSSKRENVKQECNSTTLDLYGEGPFYTPNPPVIQNGKLTQDGESGTKLIISGIVKTLDCFKVIENTEIDIWHANDNGEYDNSGFNLRGTTSTNSQGYYIFETILPGKYLNADKYRPRHIHFKITPPGFTTLTTQLYFEGDVDISDDQAASVTQGDYDATNRIIPLTDNNGVLEGTWDIIIDGDGVLGVNDIHLDKGMIYSVSPNPFTDYIEIYYGVYNTSRIQLEVYDINGRLVAEVNKEHLSPEKYTAIWKPSNNLSSGTYFCGLKINDLQVHYKKIIKL